MKAVILAAGKGKRLKQITNDTPKVMIRINGKPILEYHIKQLAQAGIVDIYINLHHLPEKIKHYFEDGHRWGVDISYSYEEKILGTAGAIKNLEKELTQGEFLVVYGDNYLNIDYGDLMKFSKQKKGIATTAAYEKEEVKGTGILDFNENGEVLRFKEKPREDEVFSHWVNAGVYYFRKEIFNFIEPGFSDFAFDVFPRILRNKKKLYAYKLKNKVHAIDTPELLTNLMNQYSKRGMHQAP